MRLDSREHKNPEGQAGLRCDTGLQESERNRVSSLLLVTTQVELNVGVGNVEFIPGRTVILLISFKCVFRICSDIKGVISNFYTRVILPVLTLLLISFYALKGINLFYITT